MSKSLDTALGAVSKIGEHTQLPWTFKEDGGCAILFGADGS